MRCAKSFGRQRQLGKQQQRQVERHKQNVERFGYLSGKEYDEGPQREKGRDAGEGETFAWLEEHHRNGKGLGGKCGRMWLLGSSEHRVPTMHTDM